MAPPPPPRPPQLSSWKITHKAYIHTFTQTLHINITPTFTCQPVTLKGLSLWNVS